MQNIDCIQAECINVSARIDESNGGVAMKRSNATINDVATSNGVSNLGIVPLTRNPNKRLVGPSHAKMKGRALHNVAAWLV